MTLANVARIHGDDFQARLFWLHATSLLDSRKGIIKVGYETGPKSFDDIQLDYDPALACLDHRGSPILRRHIQVKYHVTTGTFGYEDLTDPAFLNAESFSLLQRLRKAQEQHAGERTSCQYRLVTNWRIRADDPLIELVRKESDAIDIARLFDGTTDRSSMGKVRRCFREHLGVDDAGLEKILGSLAVAESPASLATLRDNLDDRFAVVGLRRVPSSESAFLYDDLAAKLLAQGRIEFDRAGFYAMCAREGLLSDKAPFNGLSIGVRSFLHPIDDMEERCDRMLDLVPYFDDRYIRNPAEWAQRIEPELRDFVLSAARTSQSLRLVLDAHISLAFAVGAILNVKSGKSIEIEQRTAGRRFWSADDSPANPDWPVFQFRDETIDDGRDNVALAISLTHDVTNGVRAFAAQGGVRLNRILHCTPRGGPSQTVVHSGSHAWTLAQQMSRQLQAMRTGGGDFRHVHIFIAGPNGFVFFLGQHQQAIGQATTYEWDFDGRRGGGYCPGLTFGH